MLVACAAISKQGHHSTDTGSTYCVHLSQKVPAVCGLRQGRWVQKKQLCLAARLQAAGLQSAIAVTLLADSGGNLERFCQMLCAWLLSPERLILLFWHLW